jgi:2-iminoacetate synthase
MHTTLPIDLSPSHWLSLARGAARSDVQRALDSPSPGAADFAALISPEGGDRLEEMAARALQTTRRHFGNTVSLYVPLYLSNYCSSGCSYCGFASDRAQRRSRLDREGILRELDAIRSMGFDEVLLLTGERSSHTGFDYILEAVALAAKRFAAVAIEAFPMSVEEYRMLAGAGCMMVTIYQETYDRVEYARLHRWGPKRDYGYRLETPARVLEAGIRMAGMGVLLGLSDPQLDVISLYCHVIRLHRHYWQSGISLSFPRICPQEGGYIPPHPVDDRYLAQFIFAFRICLPEFPLVLSTRESPRFRDGMAGLGINKMSIASRTTVGGYTEEPGSAPEQFQISDDRNVETFCAMLRTKGLEPVFKNWDRAYH